MAKKKPLSNISQALMEGGLGQAMKVLQEENFSALVGDWMLFLWEVGKFIQKHPKEGRELLVEMRVLFKVARNKNV